MVVGLAGRAVARAVVAQGARYGGVLRQGDHDGRRVWGGTQQPGGMATPGAAAPGAAAPGPVRALQADLAAVGTYLGTLDGAFGPGTAKAVCLFQWNAANQAQRLLRGQLVGAVAPLRPAGMTPTGIVDAATARQLGLWVLGGLHTTGDLVRVAASGFANVQLGGGFRRIAHAGVGAGDVVMARPLLADLRAMDVEAGRLGMTLNLNQALRIAGAPVSGAVVTPARKSQHLLGHALDLNMIDGTSWNTAADFRAGNETENAKTFIATMKANGMRWGGDFRKADTPHFDRELPSGSEVWDYKYFFNQRSISQVQPLARETA